jgi:ribosome recycling factor
VPNDPKTAALLKETEQKMNQTLEATRHDFAGVRTGRANPALLDRVTIENYGQVVPIKQAATISAPEPRLITISPWDKTTIKRIVDAITSSDLGLNPVSDGNLIRVPLPTLTEERRRELAKLVAKKTEEGKIAIRNLRRDAIEELRKLEKAHSISEDDLKRFQDRVQKLTDDHSKELDKMHASKEQELMEV